MQHIATQGIARIITPRSFYTGSRFLKLVHTLSDSLSPSHAGFQYFDLQNSVAHLYAERYSVYLNDYKDIVNNKLNSELRSVLDKIMKVAE